MDCWAAAWAYNDVLEMGAQARGGKREMLTLGTLDGLSRWKV